MKDSEQTVQPSDNTETAVESKGPVIHPFSSGHYLMIVRKAKKDRIRKRKRANIAKQSRQLNRKLRKSR